jgi:trk system potassium uptake protein TrkH
MFAILNLRAVTGILGALLFFLAITLLLPMGVAFIYGEPEWWSFGVASIIGFVIGGLAWRRYRPEEDFGVREGFVIVALAWFVLSLLGAIPFVVSGVLDSYTDAFFETMSGLTTTGATIFGGEHTPAIEEMPRSFLFWRSLAHWLGGMGIIVLTLAILPVLGVGGMQMYRAEVPGPSADKLTPRVKETAKRLWLIYVGITAVEVVLLLPAMGFFDAVNHAFATMATGGFSTKNGSVGQFDSAYVDWIITLFMLIAGVNFALHYRVLKGQFKTVINDRELRFYISILIVATLILTAAVLRFGMPDEGTVTYDSPLQALRYASFQAVAIVTTTGFGTADYEAWPALAIGLIFLLFFVGGMAGSTGGGVKVIRHLLLYKHTYAEMRRLVHPKAIIPLRVSGRVVPPDVMRNVLSFIVLYVAMVAVGTLLMSLLGQDLLTSIGGSISCVGNIGPAFGSLGPAENYAHLPMMSKWILAMLMMLGRLEIFTVLVLFVPAFWRR